MSQQSSQIVSTGFKPSPGSLPNKKRLIICCDGTWQSSNHGVQSTPSNIAKISRAIQKYTQEKDGSYVQQIVWYDAGVGTATDSVKTKIAEFLSAHQGTWGEGLDENVCEAYNFIVNNYSKGDELYFFGFSRGAYTVRAAAGLVARVGICDNAQMDDFYLMYQAYKMKGPGEDMSVTGFGKTEKGKAWLAACDQDFTIECIGVFDTVGAVGWPENMIFDVTAKNKPFAFHSTDVNPKVKNAFQALGLDEHRASFPPTVWSIDDKTNTTTNLIQCWFPGYHINIGGGSGDFQKDPEHRRGDFEAMANITFSWMIDRVNQYTPLGIDPQAIYQIIERYAQNIETLVQAQNTASGHEHTKIYRGWGIGPNVDSYNWKMAIAGSKVRTPAEYNHDTHKTTHEYIHPVVAYAATNSEWHSNALTGFKRESKGPGKGYVWKKTYTPASTEGYLSRAWSYISGKYVPAQHEVHLELPEFDMPGDYGPPGDRHTSWGMSIERHLIRADTRRFWSDGDFEKQERKEQIQQTLDFFKKLDEGNGHEKLPEADYQPAKYFNYHGETYLFQPEPKKKL